MLRKPVALTMLALLTIIGPATLLFHVQSRGQRTTTAGTAVHSARAVQKPAAAEPPAAGAPSSAGRVAPAAELPPVDSAACGTVRNPCVPSTARVRIPPSSAGSGFSPEILNASVLTHGDAHALLRVKQKLERGEAVEVAVFGGSISRGHQLDGDAPEGTSGAVLRDEYTWGGQLVAWLNAHFPVKLGAKRHTLRNLAKPASGSKYAAEHYEQLLQPEPDVGPLPPPDLVLCEFGVNDAAGCSQKDSPDCLKRANRELARCKCRPHAVYTEQLLRGLFMSNANTAVVYVEFSTGFTQGSVLK